MDIREADDQELLDELSNRRINIMTLFSDTQLNNELTRRRQEAEKRYEEMMEQGLV